MATPAIVLPDYCQEEKLTGIWSWLTTVDHKRIGVLYGATALFFFLVGGIEALTIRAQLIVPDNDLVSAHFFNGLFTMHATTMIFLVVMPMSAAFFNYMVPLMIGARDVAFPRLNAFSYWTFLFGGIFINASFFFGEAPAAGWFGYANLTSSMYSPGIGVDFWALGLQILGIASLAAGFNFIVTILNMRAPGMTLMRMPVFVWMTLVVQFLVVLSFPMITVALILLSFDRFFGTNFYVPEAGGDPLLWQHLFWLFGHPEVYILILPPMGMVSEVLPVFSRKPLFGAPFVIFSGILIGFVGFGVWSHHMFTTGLGPVADTAFSMATMLIAVPTGVKIFNWLATIWGGSIRFSTAMWFALGFISMFTIGGLSGIMHASPPIDLQQQDSYFVVAHIHYVLYGGAIMGLFAGIYYWFPKVTGRLLDEKLGKAHFWLGLVALNVTFFPMHFLGMQGMPRRIFTYEGGLGWDLYNFMATIGAFALAFSVLIFFINIVKSLRDGEVAGGDPWDAATLEWTISSPPPVHNFDLMPNVTSDRPFWDQKYGDATDDTTEMAEDLPDELHIHMPPGSYWPMLTSFGVLTVFCGLMIHPVVLVTGALIVVVSIVSWNFEPA
ncbi:MAG: cytochrome c oxidase subunit I [Alphaproteobacteria bacterium]|nr:cytochrome c oxidase subunit I [Alphaproteobacteria bacterium]